MQSGAFALTGPFRVLRADLKFFAYLGVIGQYSNGFGTTQFNTSYARFVFCLSLLYYPPSSFLIYNDKNEGYSLTSKMISQLWFMLAYRKKTLLISTIVLFAKPNLF